MKKPDIFKEKFVKTIDADYFQAYPNSTVKVILRKKRRQKITTISVWGDDDIGVINCFENYDEAVNVFNKIDNGISQKQLEFLGFKQD